MTNGVFMYILEYMNTKVIGDMGEDFINSLLPDSVLTRGGWSRYTHHDLDWKDFKIEVKTRTKPGRRIRSTKRHYQFSVSGLNDADLYIFLGVDGKKKYLWLFNQSELLTNSKNCSTDTAIRPQDLLFILERMI